MTRSRPPMKSGLWTCLRDGFGTRLSAPRPPLTTKSFSLRVERAFSWPKSHSEQNLSSKRLAIRSLSPDVQPVFLQGGPNVFTDRKPPTVAFTSSTDTGPVINNEGTPGEMTAAMLSNRPEEERLKKAVYRSSLRAFRLAERKPESSARARSMAQMVANFAATLFERTVASSERGTRGAVHTALGQRGPSHLKQRAAG